jgi:hypothetical protein
VRWCPVRAAPGHVPLLPRLWSDPYAIAAVLHGAWRAYVVTSGMFYAYTIYASINKGITQTRLVHTHPGLHRRLGGPAGSSSSGSGAGGLLGARHREGRLVQPVVGPVQPLRHHLSLSLPVAAGRAGVGGRDRVDGTLLATIRERFHKATMVQVRVVGRRVELTVARCTGVRERGLNVRPSAVISRLACAMMDCMAMALLCPVPASTAWMWPAEVTCIHIQPAARSLASA